MECDLLRYMVLNQGRIISRKELLEQVWRVREDTDTRAIDNFMVRLRRYIEDNPPEPVFLEPAARDSAIVSCRAKLLYLVTRANTFAPLPGVGAGGRLPDSSMLSLLWVRR